MTTLIIVNEGPYAGERAFNAMRLAAALRRRGTDARVRIFLMSDGVQCALPNHLRPEGSYNIERMLTDLLSGGVAVRACTTCLDQRGLFAAPLIGGVQVTGLPDLAEWVVEADRVVTF